MWQQTLFYFKNNAGKDWEKKLAENPVNAFSLTVVLLLMESFGDVLSRGPWCFISTWFISISSLISHLGSCLQQTHCQAV